MVKSNLTPEERQQARQTIYDGLKNVQPTWQACQANLDKLEKEFSQAAIEQGKQSE